MGNLTVGFVLLVLACVVYTTMACGCCCCGDSTKPKDCGDIQASGSTNTGIYKIYPGCMTSGIKVRCDMHTAGGGWTVIQRRYNGYSFYRNWIQYQNGFGNLLGNHWLGNLNIHAITCQGQYKLRIDMRHGNLVRYAEYDFFAISDHDNKFRLTIGKYHGNAGDSLSYHNGQPFSTWDQDNDSWPQNCAVKFHGAWWYKKCHVSNLNGLYGSTIYGKGINWHSLTGYYKSLIRVEMKIKKV